MTFGHHFVRISPDIDFSGFSRFSFGKKFLLIPPKRKRENPEKSISDEIRTKWCQNVILSIFFFFASYCSSTPIKASKTFQRGLRPVKGRKIGLRDLLFFHSAAFPLLLTKYATEIRHYLEKKIQKEIEIFCQVEISAKKKVSPKFFL